ncbi:MAG: hypothetical protein ACE5I5_16265 [Candidatus Heimdallarchaeota archaeon]
MIRKGEVVSLAIFVMVGLLIGSLLASGGPVEQTETVKGDFEGVENGFEGSGGVSANVIMGVYTPDGDPVEIKRLGASFLPWMYTNGGGTTSTNGGGTGKQITDYWQGTVSQIIVTGKNVKPSTISVLVRWIWDSPAGVKVLKEKTLSAGAFTVQGDAHSFVATATWSDTYKGQLQTIASNHGVNCKVASFHWKFRIRISCSAQEADSVTKIQATAKQITQEFDTSYSTEPIYGTGTLSLDANVNNYVDPNYHSFVPGDPAGLSVVFIFVVIFVGLWYWKGRKLIQWG